VLRILYALVKVFFLLLIGKRDIRNFTVSHARNKLERETNQVTKPGTDAIEARVLHDEQHRTGIQMRHAYAH
jgi:uncharacterized membrane protein